jgi:hypothetical protein
LLFGTILTPLGFFRAIAFIEEGDQEKWEAIRKKQADYLHKNATKRWVQEGGYDNIKRYVPEVAEWRVVQQDASITDYARAMREEGKCGDVSELHILCRRLRINVIVLTRYTDEGGAKCQAMDRYRPQESEELNELTVGPDFCWSRCPL